MVSFSTCSGALPAKQRGAVLFVALVFLLLMTLLAIVASRTSVLQERMAGGARSNQLGLMGSESVLRESEFRLWSLAERTSMAGGGLQLFCGPNGKLGGCFTRNADIGVDPRVSQFRDPAIASPPDGIATVYGPVVSGITDISDPRATGSLARQPVVIFEDLGLVPPPGTHKATGKLGQGNTEDPETRHLYRMTARSPGGSDNVLRVVESTFMAQIPKSVSSGSNN